MQPGEQRTHELGPYLVVGEIGRGGFGTVYLAHDRRVRGENVRALKLLAERDDSTRRRLYQEASAMARVRSPHCLRVYEVIAQESVLAIVTEFVEGASLRALLREHGRLTGPQALSVLRGALIGLAAVHAAGLVHGDVKPDNILVDRTGSARMIDFGLAEPTGTSAAGEPVSGSPTYLSPERISGSRVDGRSDLYAMGVLLFELLSGRRPFPGATAGEMLELHLHAPVPDLREVVPDAGDELAQLCAAALQKDPAARPQTADEFLAALEKAARRRYGDGWLAAGTGVTLGGLTTAILGSAGTISGAAVAGAVPGALTGGAAAGTQLAGAGLPGLGVQAPLGGGMSASVAAGHGGVQAGVTAAKVGGGISRAFHALIHSGPAMATSAVVGIAAIATSAIVIASNKDGSDVAGPLSPARPTSNSETQLVNYNPLQAAGTLKSELTVAEKRRVDACFVGPVGEGRVFQCGSTADDLATCWPKDDRTAWCQQDPSRNTVVEVATDLPFPTGGGIGHQPSQVELSDGTICRIRLGGAAPARDDDYFWAYSCDADNRILVTATGGVFDQTQPQWTAKSTTLTNGTPPVTEVAVKTAWFPVNPFG